MCIHIYIYNEGWTVGKPVVGDCTDAALVVAALQSTGIYGDRGALCHDVAVGR